MLFPCRITEALWVGGAKGPRPDPLGFRPGLGVGRGEGWGGGWDGQGSWAGPSWFRPVSPGLGGEVGGGWGWGPRVLGRAGLVAWGEPGRWVGGGGGGQGPGPAWARESTLLPGMHPTLQASQGPFPRQAKDCSPYILMNSKLAYAQIH